MAPSTAMAEYERRLQQPVDTRQHLRFLHETVLFRRAPVVFELGVAWGNTTSALLSAAEQARGHLWSCDASEIRVPADWPCSPHWHFRRDDDLSPGTLVWFPGQCDVLFVDSDHRYEHVLATLRAYIPRVTPGGVALFHDTHYLRAPGGQDVELPGPDGPVAKALDVYCAESGLSWENRPGSYGLGVLKIG